MAYPTKDQIREREALAKFGIKRCGSCLGIKPRVNFSRQTRARDGLRSECKDCVRRYREAHKAEINERGRQYYRANSEAKLEYQRQYRLENREALKESQRQYRLDNKEAINERKRQYYRANSEAKLEYQRQYRLENREALKESQRQYREQNREALKEYLRQHYRDNREARLEYNRQYRQTPEGRAVRRKSDRKRRALKAAVNENFTAEDEAFVFERDGYRCVDCGITNQEHIAQFGQRLHIDHVLPLSKGHALTRENAALRCRSCNSSKGNRS